jgi:hypothetical protein
MSGQNPGKPIKKAREFFEVQRPIVWDDLWPPYLCPETQEAVPRKLSGKGSAGLQVDTI